MLGRKFTVIGVFEKVGESLVGEDMDEVILIPAATMRKMVNPDRLNGNMIMAKASSDADVDIFKDELRVAMRNAHRLKPRVEDDFSLNEISLINNQLDQLFKVVGLAGTLIGGFSILVGGFGIANIMFVSVSERKNQIGIQKSLGAKNYFVLLQFLFEAVILSVIGGLFGLLVVYFLVEFLDDIVSFFGGSFDFELILTTKNILLGLAISAVIGLVSGTVPALMAARLNPVDAIRSGQ
jgi:putative ABC transport system permease protein